MNRAGEIWQRLARAAGQAGGATPVTAPHGFAHRVIARWLATEKPSVVCLWEWLCLRTSAVACAVMLATLFLNFDAVSLDWTRNLSVADSLAGPLI